MCMCLTVSASQNFLRIRARTTFVVLHVFTHAFKIEKLVVETFCFQSIKIAVKDKTGKLANYDLLPDG